MKRSETDCTTKSTKNTKKGEIRRADARKVKGGGLGLVETRHALSNDEKVKNGLHHEEHEEFRALNITLFKK
jgi:hypothetical protein